MTINSGSYVRKVVELMFWNVIFPEKCMVCGSVLESVQDGVCYLCKKKMPYIRGLRCNRCGKKLVGLETVCSDCRKHRHIYSQGFALFEYNRKTETIIADIKYNRKISYISWLAKELIYHSEQYIRRWAPQLIIPVPLHRNRYRLRGFNQAGLIAGRLAKEYGIEYDEKLLFRKHNTKAQKYLNDAERKANLKSAFILDKARLDRYPGLERVVIVDDIYTTGSTIDACARELIKAGVREVYYLAVSVGNGYD